MMENKPIHLQETNQLSHVFEIINQLFPFHFIFDYELNFIQVGKNIKKIDRGCKEGTPFLNHFEIFSALESISFHNLVQKKNEVFVLSFLKADIKLKGQLIPYESNGCIVFVGNPIVSDTSLLSKNNISLNDFAPFDTTPDFLSSKKAQETSFREIQALVKKLQTSQTKLLQSNSELKQFAYIASHDLQSPLRTIISFAQLLEKKYNTQIDPIAKEYMDFIISGTKRMQNLINDLLAYSRVWQEKNSFEWVEVDSIIQSVKEDMYHDIKTEEATIECYNLPRIYANPRLLNQLFQNLISNAIKFRQIEPPVIKIYCEEKRYEWEFIIIDNGVGFDMENGKKIFKIFQRAVGHETYEGTGIGLAICKKVVENHKGRIWVHSQPLEGTTFHFTINKFLSSSYS